MSNFLSQLFSTSEAVEAAKPAEVVLTKNGKVCQKYNGGQKKSTDAQARYAEVFASPTPVSVAAAKMGISHVACLNQVYRYERKGWMGRAGVQADHGRAILFVWTKQ